MREIKFRAWDEVSKKWVYHIVPNKGCPSAVWEGSFDWDDLLEWKQFTGLKDKNGREIWEGDILSFPDTESEYVDVGIGNVKVAEFPLNAFFPVEFKECEFGMTVEGTEHGINGWISLRAFNEDYYKMSECEVIGNIYENPELLK